jgi:superfamily II DNA helicase RecQ
VFNKDYEQIISLSDKRYIQDLRRIFNSESFKNSRSIINLEKLVDETGLNYFKINDILKYLINRNLMKVLREEHKDLIQINKEINSFNVSPLVELFKEVLNKSYQKVDELVECFNSQTCIRKSILTYFDEPQLKETCKMCSNCIAYEIIKQIPIEINENYASDEEINKIGEQILDIEHDEFHVLLLKAIGIDRYIPEKDFVNILKGKLHRFSAKWKFNINSYGLLKDKEDSEIDEIVNKLISDSLVEITPEGILRLTKKGINYLEKDEKHFINVESSQKIRKDKKELFCESCGKQIKHRGKCLSCNIKVKINKLKIF